MGLAKCDFSHVLYNLKKYEAYAISCIDCKQIDKLLLLKTTSYYCVFGFTKLFVTG